MKTEMTGNTYIWFEAIAQKSLSSKRVPLGTEFVLTMFKTCKPGLNGSMGSGHLKLKFLRLR